MDYLELIKRQPPEKEALVEDGTSFSYGDLANLAHAQARKYAPASSQRAVRVIKEQQISHQLISFLACFLTGDVPLVVPWESRHFQRDARIMAGEVPRQACMAVATSGTSGKPKIYFRTYESWAGYFPIQNQIFHIRRDSRLFAQGSLSFTGNMNLYLAQFYAGATVIAENEFQPVGWARRMVEQRADHIYLIPSKLLLLPRAMNHPNHRIETILSGSQGLGKPDARALKAIFPKAEIILYYGATELSYITYITDDRMTEQRNLIGKPFPKVEVGIKGEEIYVSTPYCAEGISCPYTLSDKGAADAAGNLYFLGRSDDVLLHRGRKISAAKVENLLMEIRGVEEAAVCMAESSHWKEAQIAAYLVAPAPHSLTEQSVLSILRGRLHRHEIPRRVFFVDALPRNASGKVDKKQLRVLK